MFLDNCEYKRSLHGPLEVMSRRAFEIYSAESVGKCDTSVMQEDVYLRWCLVNLGVTHVDSWMVLAEEYCFWDWKSCQNDHASFHPFKAMWDYKRCVSNAEAHGGGD